ncbi:serine hydrolase [Bacillus atrophaeus]|uniref:serine hydrolase domain-containing protein n=1 Tax=Bacillus atrophaeus TaxID=1452 RepID=UPI0022825691|nr:serine hydrolase [Bacillus atrophaeus]MCY8910322.1 beta-lactamase family protein [Bacillus atrophaeus]MEC0835923.1 serine hydrolase [Bacillus atrophaeus]MEC0847027.1 serine hydrolase [Bacillus atrophaeus]MEC0848342.1 serine hydrolase [Bacillus atrophaeus]MEC0864801.1 serine hydrolase [Bacillus atrophaeus]
MNNVNELVNRDAKSVGMNSDKLKELETALNFQLGIINSVVVVRKGGIIFEKYFHGLGPNDTFDVTSLTQNIMSALIGIAIDLGYIKSVDQMIIDFFPEAASEASDLVKRSLTIKHLLTMTAPHAWKGNEPLDRLRRQKDWTMYILKTLGQKGKVGEFQYSLASAHLLSVILTRSTGVSTREFANEHLFRPLGMREIPDQKMKSFSKEDVFGKNITGWIKDPQGYNTGGWGLTLTARDMAHFGYLYVNRGKWANKQIISENWIDESTAQHTDDFGYLWWMREDNGIVTYIGAGIGGTYIYCIPEKELVVVVASKVDKMIIDRWELVEDYILPAIN